LLITIESREISNVEVNSLRKARQSPVGRPIELRGVREV
jgi:hypothetical protein